MGKLTKAVTGRRPESPAAPDSNDADRDNLQGRNLPVRSRARRRIAPPKSPIGGQSVRVGGQSSIAEPEALKEARRRLKPLVDQVVKGRPPNAIGLFLAIITQETGNHAAANVLIDEYGLDKAFGLMKTKN